MATGSHVLSRSSSRNGSESPAVKPGGTVLSVAPLMGTEPDCDPVHAQWLHVHVRPPVRALLKVIVLSAAVPSQSSASVMSTRNKLTVFLFLLGHQRHVISRASDPSKIRGCVS